MPVEVKGAIRLRKALREFDPDLAKETNKQLKEFAQPVIKKARGYLPTNNDVPSGWLKRDNSQSRWATSAAYDSGKAKRGIVFSSAPTKLKVRGWKSTATLFNKSAGGSIYETAGRKSGIVGNFTPRLGGVLRGEGQKMTGRALFRAYQEDQGKARDNIIKAIEAAAAKLNAKATV